MLSVPQELLEAARGQVPDPVVESRLEGTRVAIIGMANLAVKVSDLDAACAQLAGADPRAYATWLRSRPEAAEVFAADGRGHHAGLHRLQPSQLRAEATAAAAARSATGSWRSRASCRAA